MKKTHKNEGGFTLVEMVTALGVFSIIALSILGLYSTLVSTAVVMKQKSIALSVASNQIEYIKSLPFSSLAVSGGSIYSTNPMPATTTKTLNNVNYTVKTSINYVDDAFDGCASYPNATLRNLYCRNQPSPSGSTTDTNPQDYKVVNVKVLSKSNAVLAEADTQVAAKVAETASTTGAMFISVTDGEGNPVSGANVRVTNGSTTPATDLNDSTDSNGTAIFYGLIQDSGYDYTLTASKSGSSTLRTIAVNGSLQPNYPNLQILSQQSSYATMVIKPQGSKSLLIESTDTAGTALSGVKTYVKGGYKSYTASTNTAYYYDTLSPTDIRPTTDSGGLVALSNLVPGPYIFCGDTGATSCTRSGSTQYLVAAVPYSGTSSLSPINVPTQESTDDPGTSFTYGGSSYLQKVRLMFSTSSTFPRITNLKPDNLSLATTPLTNFSFQVNGANLPCSSSASSCNTSVKLTNGSSTYTASCTGASAGLQLTCKVNLTGVSTGTLQLIVAASGQTLTLPGAPLLGGINVLP